jgi:hypothetical protein
MKKVRPSVKYIVSILLLLCFATLGDSSVSIVLSDSIGGAQAPIDFSQAFQSLNMTAIRENIAYFSSFPTRATGYPGNLESGQYIFDCFSQIGLENVSFYNFNFTDCFDQGSNITILSTGESVTIHALWPNLISPSTTPLGGLTGPIIYAGRGDLKDFDNKTVEGSIVLLDWDSGDGWLNAAKLGAKAVIFLPAKVVLPSVFGEKDVKYDPRTPIKFPRFYVEKAGESLLMNHISEEARIVCTQQWMVIEGRNVVGWIEGTESPETYVLLSAHYDSYSIAPGSAPGAQEAIGISALLEIAKYLVTNKPKYSVIVAAFDAHHHNLEGAVTFAYDFVHPGKGPSLGTPTPPQWLRDAVRDGLKLNINLDMTTGTNVLYLYPFALGYYQDHHASTPFEQYRPIAAYFNAMIDGLWQNYGLKVVEKLETVGGYLYAMYIRTEYSWKQFPFDSEVFYMAGISAYSFTTAFDCRAYYLVPFDTLENVNFQNLEPQLEAAFYIITRVVQEDRFLDMWGVFHPDNEQTRSKSWWAAGIIGQVVEYNVTEAWYTEVPHSLVALTQQRSAYGGSVVQRKFTFADEEGKFRFYYCYLGRSHYVSAWVVNATGDITYAPDFGANAWGTPGTQGAYYNGIWTNTNAAPPENEYGESIFDISLITSFKAASIVLFDVFVPHFMSHYQAGAVVYDNSIGVIRVPQYTTIQTYSKLPIFAGEDKVKESRGGVEFIAVPPNTRISIIVKTKAALERYPTGILINYSSENPENIGYVLEPGQQLFIGMTPLEFAKNFYGASENILGALIATTPSEAVSTDALLHEETKKYIDLAEAALENNQYSEAYTMATNAWLTTTRAYAGIRGKTESFIYTVPLLALMLLPFVYLTQRLLFGQIGGYKRLAIFICMFAIILVFFYFVHPGFVLAASPIMTVIGFSTLILTLPIVGVIFTKFTAFLKSLRVKFMGVHEVEVSRVSAIIQSFLIGIENMRKMKLRTGLTLVSFIIMIMSVVSLTSISVSPITKVGITGETPLYQGVYIHKPAWGMGQYEVNPAILEIIETTYDDATVVPRAWKHTLEYGSGYGTYREIIDPDLMIGFKSTYTDKLLSTPILWGLTPQEKDLTHPELFFVGNRSRWFIETDRRACILMESQAAKLGITSEELPVTINFEGMPFAVIGIIQKGYALIVEMDTEEIAPIKFDLGPQMQTWDIHVTGDYCLIMPYQTVIDLAGGLTSVSVVFEDATAEVLGDRAMEIHQRFSSFYAYYGLDTAFYVSEASQVYLFRWGPQVIMITLVAISVLNMMMGNVYQRKRHIHIYSTVGLSPLHISSMFLAETLTFALIGGLLGYISGLLLGRVALGLFEGTIILNYASSWVLIALGVAMLTAMLSSIYPMFLAARLVTPSMERKWKMPTKPVGDMWEIPFPVVVTSEKEAISMLAYLKEFCEGHLIDAPVFLAEDLKLGRDEKDFPMLSLRCRLYPYELGLRQDASLHAVEFEAKWTFSIRLKRTLGPRDDWEKQNRGFIDLMRKQLVLWKTLPESEKKRYSIKI